MDSEQKIKLSDEAMQESVQEFYEANHDAQLETLKPVVSPNPAEDYTNLMFPLHKYTWEVYSVLGLLIQSSASIVNGVDKINTAELNRAC